MKNRKAALSFILFTVALDMVGIGLIIPSLPDVVRRFVSDETIISQYFGYFISVYALMQFIASPFLGALSDRYGRRPVLFVSIFVACLDYLLMAYAPSLFWLFLGRVVSGLSGANITVAMAYTADVSTESNRAKNFGMIGAAFGIGFIIGPAIGGLLGGMGPQYPFLVAALFNLLNLIFGIFVLPESLPKEKRSHSFVYKKMNPLNALKQGFKAEYLFIFLVVHFLFELAGQTHPSIWTLYTQTRFGWTHTQVGISLAIVGVMVAIVQGGLTGIIVPKLGEWRSAVIGSFGLAIAYACFAMSTQGWMMIATLVFSSFFWIYQPALQSIISKNAKPEEQGELQGTLVGLTSLAAILNPLIVTNLFGFFGSANAPVRIPGAPYYFAAFVSIVGGILLFQKRGQQSPSPSSSQN